MPRVGGIFFLLSKGVRLSAGPAFALALLLASVHISHAQQSSRPSRVDSQQTERQIDTRQLEQRRAKKASPKIPQVEKPAVQAEHIPLFKLESVSVEGASSISDEAIAAIYHPYIGTTISQTDLE